MLDAKEVTAAALALDEDERSALVELLLSSLDGPGHDVDWDAEINRRMDDIEAGRATYRDISELEAVVAELRERSR
jgi:putative addiction module component (TIGR02574 family)